MPRSSENFDSLLCLVKTNEGESALGLALTVRWVCHSLSPSPPHLSACVSVTPCHGLAVFCPPASLMETGPARVLWAVISLCSLPQSVADSSWITELLWTFFVPFTVYQVRYYLSLFHLGQGLGWAERLMFLLV